MRDAPGDTGAGEDNSEKGAPAATQVKLPQAGAAAGRETGTGEARTTATGLDEGANASQPAAQRSRLTATESVTPQSSASLVQCTDPLPAAAAAAAGPVTGKRKRAAEAEGGKEAETDEETTEMREVEPRKKKKGGRKKKKKKSHNHRRMRRARKN